MGDTAENALDWPGEYKGILPCKDCKGIETELELKLDNRFELSQDFRQTCKHGKQSQRDL